MSFALTLFKLFYFLHYRYHLSPSSNTTQVHNSRIKDAYEVFILLACNYQLKLELRFHVESTQSLCPTQVATTIVRNCTCALVSLHHSVKPLVGGGIFVPLC